jgi:hypothetical protein
MTEITPEDLPGAATDTAAKPDPALSAKQMLGDAGRAVRQETAQFAGAAKERARGVIGQRKETATRTLGDFADAVRKAGDELTARDQSMASRLVGQAADSLEGLSRTVADKRPEELLDAVRDFGRRNPAAFIGGAVLLGLAIGRFARASAQASSGSDVERRLADGGGDWTTNETWAQGAAPMAGAAAAPAAFGATEGETSADLQNADLRSAEVFDTGPAALSEGGDLEQRTGGSDIEGESDTGTGEGTGRAAGYSTEV